MKNWCVYIDENGVITVMYIATPNPFTVTIYIDPTAKTVTFVGNPNRAPASDEMMWYARPLFMYYRWEKHGRDENC